MELESDNKDKQREMEEIDEILRKRLSEPPTEKENEVSYHREVIVYLYFSIVGPHTC